MSKTTIPAGGLSSASVTTAKIADDAVENTKLDLTSDYAFSGTITGAGGGKLLQVQSVNFTSGVTSVTSDDFTATEVTDQITPSATSSKILVMFNVSISQYEGSGSGCKFEAGIYRSINGGTYARLYAGSGNSYGGYGESSGNTERSSSFPTTMTFLDTSHNTTNAIDYKLYLSLLTASGQGDNVNTGSSSQERSVTLIEIGA
tara:strand:- start:229 stop:837 length:609 start_codon:yes stop_codon:yes gene_type:complete